jgi:hypothetical protein
MKDETRRELQEILARDQDNRAKQNAENAQRAENARAAAERWQKAITDTLMPSLHEVTQMLTTSGWQCEIQRLIEGSAYRSTRKVCSPTKVASGHMCASHLGRKRFGLALKWGHHQVAARRKGAPLMT